MKLAVPMIAGAAVLALANVALAEDANLASADQPILLTDAQMDNVTAGTATAFFLARDVDIAISGVLLESPSLHLQMSVQTSWLSSLVIRSS